MVSKIEQTSINVVCGGQMKRKSDLSLISNCRGNSDDVTLVQQISDNLSNRLFMISIIDEYVPFTCMIAKP